MQYPNYIMMQNTTNTRINYVIPKIIYFSPFPIYFLDALQKPKFSESPNKTNNQRSNTQNISN